MRKEVLPVLLAAALVGAACQRPPEATPPPQRIPLAASGEPRPPDIEAEIQKRVQATVTAQQAAKPAEASKPPDKSPATQKAELVLFGEHPTYELRFPKGWTALRDSRSNASIFRDPQSSQDNPTRVSVYSVKVSSVTTIKTAIEENRFYFDKVAKKDAVVEQVAPIDGYPALKIETYSRSNPNSPKYDLRQVLILIGEEVYVISLEVDPSQTAKVMPVFKEMYNSFTLKTKAPK